MSSPDIKVSIVILTANRNRLLQKCLHSLALACDQAKNVMTFETIILINGPSHGTRELIDQEFGHLHYTVLNRDQRLNPGWARNTAVNQACGDWIFFADDDITVEADFFLNFCNLIRARSEYCVFGGPNLTPPDSDRFQKLSGAALSSRVASFHCSRRYKLTHERCDTDDSALTLCNLFVKRQSLGDRRFARHLVCAEENNLLAQLSKTGLRFVAHPDLKVYHERRPNYRGFAEQVFKYGRGRGQLMPSGRIKLFHLVPLLSVILFLLLAFANIPAVLLLSLTTVYGLLLISAAAASVVSEKLSLFDLPEIVFLILTIHVGYAFGLSCGFAEETAKKISRRLLARRL